MKKINPVLLCSLPDHHKGLAHVYGGDVWVLHLHFILLAAWLHFPQMFSYTPWNKFCMIWEQLKQMPEMPIKVTLPDNFSVFSPWWYQTSLIKIKLESGHYPSLMHGTRFSAPCRPVTQTSLPQGFPSEVGLVYVRGIVKTPTQPQLNST